MKVINQDQEADRIIANFGENAMREIMIMIEGQFNVLHNRAQVLLGLCGIIISTTGFSGRNIAGTGPWAQILVLIGVGMILLSAAVVSWGVLYLRWLTIQPGQNVREWLIASLKYRDAKTRSYRIGLILMIVGLAGYVSAIMIMLAHPDEAPLYMPK